MKKLSEINAAAARLVPGLQVDLAGVIEKVQRQGLEATIVAAGCDLLVLTLKAAHARARAPRRKA